MKRRKIVFRSSCPIGTALDIFGDKWSLLIIRDLVFKGKRSYGEFLASEEGIATNILADRLALLESAGIVSKHAHPASGAKIIYALTKKGIGLVPVLVEIIAWSAAWHDVHPQAKAFAKTIRRDKQAVLNNIILSLEESTKQGKSQ